MKTTYDLIKAGLFDQASYLLKTASQENMYVEVCEDILKERNIIPYIFICFLISKESSNSLNTYALGIMYGCFGYLNGADALGYAHHLSRLEKDPTNINLIEYQLMFYEYPDEIFSDPEAREIAKKVLVLRPDSGLAEQIMRLTARAEHSQLIPLGNGLSTYEHVQLFIEKGRFSLAFNEIPNISHDELLTILKSISSEKNITAYGFIWAMINQQETAQLQLLAAQFFAIHFNDLKGAPSIVFFHTHRAAELKPDNLEIQEQLLSLYEPGNESFDLEETKALVERVLNINPKSAQGLRVKWLLK